MNIDEEMLKWSQTVYGVAHALHLAQNLKLGNLNEILESLKAAESWNPSELGFESCIPVKEFKEGSIKLDGGDHNEIFERISEGIVKILFINLAVIADKVLGYLIQQTGASPGNFLVNKAEWVQSKIDPEFHWAVKGIFELAAIRNALVHNDGRWNDASIRILEKAGVTKVDARVSISLSFSDLFRYRRPLRTVIGELKKMASME